MSNVNISPNVYLGIDLGTTNSVAAIINEKKNGQIVSKVLDLPRPADMYNSPTAGNRLSTRKYPTLSSCVYYRMDKDYEPIIGEYAKKQYSMRPHLVSKSIKSQMGKPFAEGLSPDVPDKTPAAISARILEFIRKGVSKAFQRDVSEAVITVPANFDSAMCKATLDAAEMAGFKVRNDDGSEKPVLLSEPKAVLYDLVNQINNDEFSNVILDITTKKRILVFDLGGGTLDITIHDVIGKDEVMRIEDIAANRYTQLGGDNFDAEIAKAIFEKYCKKYSNYPQAVAEITRNKDSIVMPILKTFAEDLKIQMNERYQINEGNGDSFHSGWDDDEDDEEIFDDWGGPVGGLSYACDGRFTRQELEEILSVFMAEELSYDDYKNLESITNTDNIIYPILDVLKKASDKLKTSDIKIDAVVVNGGMSKFYMVINRLTKFFGFEPIAELDPDQAVARGAAVYHYYLKKHEELKEDMKMVGNASNSTAAARHVSRPARIIEISKNINNDSLYLGVKNDVVHEIIPASVELPYISDVMTGFMMEPRTKMISIPIKVRTNNGTYRTISKGNISFKKTCTFSPYVAFRVHMGINKIITMNAWRSTDELGLDKIDEGTVEIAIDNSDKSNAGTRIISPTGTDLNPRAEIETLRNLYRNLEKNPRSRSETSKRIFASVNNIANAGNKESFSDVILYELQHETRSDEYRSRLFYLARKLGAAWSDDAKRRLARICMSQIAAPLLTGDASGGLKISADNQAIYTLSICGSSEQLKKLNKLHRLKKYNQACIYTHGKTCSEMDWLSQQLLNDVEKARMGNENNLQFSAYAIGAALRKDKSNNSILSPAKEEEIAKELCSAIKSRILKPDPLVSCIIALGCICDQRTGASKISESTIYHVLDIVTYLDVYYDEPCLSRSVKSASIAKKMINGEALNTDEEQFLLTKIEADN